MSERFQLFRLSLFERTQIDAFETDPDRESFLRRVFGSELEFGHYGHRFYYQPDPHHSGPEALIGRLGRRVLIDENLPPHQGLEETTHEGWKACIIVVDPVDHKDGQKVAIEVDREIGGPVALMTALAKAINADNPYSRFVLEVQPVFDAASFWEFAEENYGNVTSLTFDFVAPNGLWTADKSLKRELVDLRRAIKSQEVSTTFKSVDGLETNAERIREAVEYAETGSGRIRARARGNKHFNSTEKPKTVTLEEEGGPNEPLVSRVSKRLRKILGRE